MITTNLKIEGLSSTVDRNKLKKTFGSYGPLVNVNIMEPPFSIKTTLGFKYTAFVQFSSINDAIRAQSGMNGIFFYGTNIRVTFAVPQLCSYIIYSPPFLEIYRYRKNRVLPFSANLCGETKHYLYDKGFKLLKPEDSGFDSSDYKEILKSIVKNSIVPVWIPSNKKYKTLIDQLIIDCIGNRKDIENFLGEIKTMASTLPEDDKLKIFFNKLFEYGTIESNYFIWRTFSIMNGDTFDNWSLKSYRIFKDGPIWVPPKPDFKSFDEMPKFLYHKAYHLTLKSSKHNNNDKDKLKSNGFTLNEECSITKLTNNDYKMRYLKKFIIEKLKNKN